MAWPLELALPELTVPLTPELPRLEDAAAAALRAASAAAAWRFSSSAAARISASRFSMRARTSSERFATIDEASSCLACTAASS